MLVMMPPLATEKVMQIINDTGQKDGLFPIFVKLDVGRFRDLSPRGMTILTPEQLARKRANDREAASSRECKAVMVNTRVSRWNLEGVRWPSLLTVRRRDMDTSAGADGAQQCAQQAAAQIRHRTRRPQPTSST